MRTELLSICNLSKDMGEQHLLHGLTLRLYQAEIAFLVGGADSGKTLLARLISGQLEPDEGVMHLLGKPYHPTSVEYAHEQGVFCISEDTPLIQNLSIGENIALARPPFFMHSNYKRQLEAYAQITCRESGIALDVYRPAKGLRLLEKLLTHCARALLRKAKLVIFDNILYRLSDNDILYFFKTVQILKQRGITVLLLEPIDRYALEYGDRLIFLSNGRALMDFGRGECTKEAAAAIVNTGLKTQVLPKKCVPPEKSIQRSFSCLTPTGPVQIAVNRGQILGLSCRSMETYQWYLNNAFTVHSLQDLNKSTESLRISILTHQQLQSDYFLQLSVAENIALPAARYFSEKGIFSQQQYERFLYSEFGNTLPVPRSDWHKKLAKFGNLQRQLVVLYRLLLEDSSLLIFSGITDQPNSALQENIQKVADLAVERGKSVVVFGRNYGMLDEWCHHIWFLEEL